MSNCSCRWDGSHDADNLDCPQNQAALDDRLRRAYQVALEAQHSAVGTVSIIIGRAVETYLKSLVTEPSPSFAPPTMFGFPVRVTGSMPHTIEIHTKVIV